MSYKQEEGCNSIWKEWDSLSGLVSSIPDYYQHGFSAAPLQLTCISALPDNLAIGTNAGLIYFAHLPSFNLMRLKCESFSSSVTAISCVRSVDDMIACGCHNGAISIFQIPITKERLLGGTGINNVNPTKRFTVKIHFCSITHVYWSKNSMKLFSGDIEGNIGLIEVNYENYTCTGRILFKLDSRIVQLSYSNQILAVSCMEKCVLYDAQQDILTPVGKKVRNPPGLYGCTFALSLDYPAKDVLYCARPGNKIWSAGLDGVVLFSYIHQKFPIESQIQLLKNDHSSYLPTEKVSFGYLQLMQDSVMVSHSSDCIVILDIKNKKVLGYSCAFKDIIDVAVCGNDIFVIDSIRNIHCISLSKNGFGEMKGLNNVHQRQYLGVLSDLVPSKHLMENIAKIGESVASKISTMAHPTIVSGEKHLNPEAALRISQPIQGNNSGMCISSSFEDKKESESDESITSDILVLETSLRKKVNTRSSIHASKNIIEDLAGETNSLSEETLEWTGNGLPDDTSLTIIDNNIEENEKYLADVLGLTCLKMDHKDANPVSSVSNTESDNCVSLLSEENEIMSEENSITTSGRKLSGLDQSFSSENSRSNPYLANFDLASNQDDAPLSYGPPSGSSYEPLNSKERKKSSGIYGPFSDSYSDQNILVSETLPMENLSENWIKHYLPTRMKSLIGLKNGRLCCLNKNIIYFSSITSTEEAPIKWFKNSLPFHVTNLYPQSDSILALSPNGQLFSLESKDLTEISSLSPKLLMTDICNAAADHSNIWTLTTSNSCVVFQMEKLKDPSKMKQVQISCPDVQFKVLCSSEGVIWAMTAEKTIAFRIGVSESCPEGMTWSVMESTDNQCIHLSNYNLGWRIDLNGQIFFKPLVKKEHPQGLDNTWWQISQGDYMMSSDCIVMASTLNHLWVADHDSNVTFSHQLEILTGHQWKTQCNEIWTSADGGSLFMEHGLLYCSDQSGLLFSVNPESFTVLPTELPNNEEVLLISSRPESLWVLTKSHKILIRKGLSATSTFGNGWSQLDLAEIVGVEFIHLSLGMSVVWAVEKNGSVYMRQGPLGPPSERGLSPGWLCLDSSDHPTEQNIKFSKVYAGYIFYLVWGIDQSNRIFVRQAIFPELATGTSWVHVSGNLASSIAISEDRVFILTPSGSVFERVGVSVVNYVGDYWQRIPYPKDFQLIDITISVDNRLWGLSKEGKLWRHIRQDFIDGKMNPAIEDVVGDYDPDDWEVV